MEPDSPSPARSALPRRELLAAAPAAALALGLAACGGEDEAGEGPLREGPAIGSLQELAQLERLAESTYTTGARFSSGRLASELERLAAQTAEHLTALAPILEAADGPGLDELPPPEPIFIRDSDSALRAAREAARRLPPAYVTAIPEVDSPAERIELMTMLGNDATHEVLLAEAFAGPTGLERPRGSGGGGGGGGGE